MYAFENKIVNEGSKIRVTCISRGGNALPEFEWSMGGTKLSGAKTKSLVSTVESVYELTLERSHHNKEIECKAFNKVGSLTKKVSLNVSCKLKN